MWEQGGKSKQRHMCLFFADGAFVLDFYWDGKTMICPVNSNGVELKHHIVL